MSSITDVAAKAGVSVATVSRALRDLPGVAASTRELVRSAAAELGYVPSPSAAGLPIGRTHTVGVVVPWLGRWFFTSLLDGAQRVLVEHGYDVLLYDVGGTDEAHRRILDTKLLSKRVDALLVLSLPLTSHEVAALEKLQRHHDLSRLFDLTTVAQPVREQGRVAACLLVEQLAAAGATEPEMATVTMPIRLVVRRTTGPPPD